MIARYRDGRARADGLGGLAGDARRRCARRSSERLDRFDITGALDAIWEVVRRLNRYVEETAPWQLAKDEARAAELDRVLYDLADGLRAVAVALAPYLPETRAADPRRARPAATTSRWERVARAGRAVGRRASSRRRRSSRASTLPAAAA